MKPPRIRTGKTKPQSVVKKSLTTRRPSKPTRKQIEDGNRVALAFARGPV